MSTVDRTVIRGGTVLSMDPAVGDLPTGDVLVENGRIAAVGPTLDIPGPADEIDATGTIVIPGFVDTHRHMWEAIVRGFAPEHTLPQYMSDVLGTVGPALTPHDLYLGNLLSARSALGSGVTTVQDISNIQDTPEHTDALVAALQESGLRAVFAYGNSFPAAVAAGGRLPDDVRRVRADLLPDPAARVTMALDAETAADDDAERHNAALARDLDLRVARHTAPPNPPSRLRDLGVLLPGTTFIHGNGDCVSMGHDELRIIADAGANLSVSAAIEMMMGHGYPMIADARAHPDLLLSLSVDVEVTVPGDMFTQMRAAYQAGRHSELVAGDPRLSVRDILSLATLSGAQALGLADRTGSLTPGKAADLVVLRADRPDVAPVYDPYSTVVLQMDRAHVDTVLVDGTPVVRGGRSTADDTRLLAEAARTADRLVGAGVVPGPFPVPARSR